VIRLLSAAALVFTALIPGQEQQVFRGKTEIVPVFVTVRDRESRLVRDLTRDAFEVLDNGKPQPITVFDNSPQPIRLIALVDISGSVVDYLPVLRSAVAQLVTHLRPGDMARLGTFGNEVVIAPSFSRDTNELMAQLPASAPPNNRTPLWRAVDEAMGLFDPAAPERRVVLVLSDGRDSGPQWGKRFLTPMDITKRAQEENVMVYGVGLRSSLKGAPMGGARDMGAIMSASMPDPNLGSVALDTGGGYFELRPRDDMAQTFARVVDELHSQYLIGYTPPVNDGKSHKIEVRLRDKALKAHARKAYTAPKS
jgi:Ca-activated chloride channel family protein